MRLKPSDLKNAKLLHKKLQTNPKNGHISACHKTGDQIFKNGSKFEEKKQNLVVRGVKSDQDFVFKEIKKLKN